MASQSQRELARYVADMCFELRLLAREADLACLADTLERVLEVAEGVLETLTEESISKLEPVPGN